MKNSHIRQAAAALHSRHFGKLLLMAALAAGICLVLLATGMVVIMAATGGPWSSTARYANAAGANVPYMLGAWGLLLLLSLLCSGLLQGLISAMLRICRGDEAVPVRGVFSGMRHSMKMFRVKLWGCAAVVLWGMPGFLLMMGGVMFWATCIDSLTGELALTVGAQRVVRGIVLSGMGLCISLALPAAFRHMLAPMIQADDPAVWTWDCAARSKAMTKGRKWQMARLILPELLVLTAALMLLSLANDFGLRFFRSDFAAGLFSTAAFIIDCSVLLVIAIRVLLYLCVFYLKYKGEQPRSPAG